MQICTLLTIKLIDRLFQTARHMVFFYVLFYNFLKLKISFLSCIFLAKYIIHSIVKHLKVLALTSCTPSSTTTTTEKYTIMKKKTLRVTRPNKIAKLQSTTGIKENKGQTIVRNRIFSPFLEYEMYNGYIQSPKAKLRKIERFIGFWAPLSRFKLCSHSISQGRQSMFTETSC